jgi:hypothetical protein
MKELAPVWPGAPRHVPGAALPSYRFVGGLHPHPRTHPRGSLYGHPQAVPGLPAERWREDTSWLFGIDLYHQGFLWEAHEQWEAVFFAAQDATHRLLVQALIQLAAALIQEHKGRARGVEILVAEVRRKLGRVVAALPAGARLAGLDPRRVVQDVERHFDESGPAPRLELA